MSAAVPEVRCPQCGQPSRWTPENRWRPFCSERCKQIDLGAWASGSYRVPVAEADDGTTGGGETAPDLPPHLPPADHR
jgi:endogenous inhibitor of DNA gyrase (YacG/DUF329 family)